MKKIFLLLLILPLFTACGDDDKKIEIPTKTYEAPNLTINITGLNETVLVKPSIVSAEYTDGVASIVINNVVDVKSSLIRTKAAEWTERI